MQRPLRRDVEMAIPVLTRKFEVNSGIDLVEPSRVNILIASRSSRSVAIDSEFYILVIVMRQCLEYKMLMNLILQVYSLIALIVVQLLMELYQCRLDLVQTSRVISPKKNIRKDYRKCNRYCVNIKIFHVCDCDRNGCNVQSAKFSPKLCLRNRVACALNSSCYIIRCASLHKVLYYTRCYTTPGTNRSIHKVLYYTRNCTTHWDNYTVWQTAMGNNLINAVFSNDFHNVSNWNDWFNSNIYAFLFSILISFKAALFMSISKYYQIIFRNLEGN